MRKNEGKLFFSHFYETINGKEDVEGRTPLKIRPLEFVERERSSIVQREFYRKKKYKVDRKTCFSPNKN